MWKMYLVWNKQQKDYITCERTELVGPSQFVSAHYKLNILSRYFQSLLIIALKKLLIFDVERTTHTFLGWLAPSAKSCFDLLS